MILTLGWAPKSIHGTCIGLFGRPRVRLECFQAGSFLNLKASSFGFKIQALRFGILGLALIGLGLGFRV